MKYYIQALKKYAVFSGRARRSEYWFFALFNAIALIIAAILDNVVGTAFDGIGYGIFYLVYSLAVLVPALALCVRRLHDTDRSGYWIFLVLVPLVGPIVLLVFTLQDSQSGENQYGTNPKAA
jgi:uncharacterized membrane protein YhaH (DUF805 family)